MCKAQIKHKLVKERGMEGMEERKSAKKGKCVQERGGGRWEGGKERKEGRGRTCTRYIFTQVHAVVHTHTRSRAHTHACTT